MGYDPRWKCYNLCLRKTGMGATYTITHQKERTISLQVDGVEIEAVQERKRHFAISAKEKIQRSQPRWVPLESVVGNISEVSSMTVEDLLSGSVSEDLVANDALPVFMDLRSGVYAFQETRVSLSFGGDGRGIATTQTSAFVPSLGDQWVGFNLHPQMKVEETDRVAAGQYQLRRERSGGEGFDLNLALGPRTCQDGVLPLGPDIWYHPDLEKDGGDDYYYPEWVRLGVDQTLDLADRDLYGAIAWRGPTSGESVMSSLPVLMAGFPAGSFAADPGGNVFVSWLSRLGILSSILGADGSSADPASIAGIVGENPVFHPVAPI